MDSFTQKCVFSVALLLVATLDLSSCDVLTPYAREFTPTKEISCAVCSTDELKEKENPIKRKMERRLCEERPDLFFQQCENNTYRGCGKVLMETKEMMPGGHQRPVRIVSRFCAKAGNEPEENRCTVRSALGGYSYTCVCNSDNCNLAEKPIASSVTIIFLTSLATLPGILLRHLF